MNNEGNLRFRDRKAWAQFLLIMFAMLALTIWGLWGCQHYTISPSSPLVYWEGHPSYHSIEIEKTQ